MSNTDESVRSSNGVPRERVVAIAHELKIPKEEADRMLNSPEDCWF